MKVIVLGAGVIGVSTAYYLARAGADVTVIDRQHGPALETSFANAGQISPGYSTPWAAPGIPLKALKWMFQKHAPLAIRPDGTLWQLQWMASMLRNCTRQRYAVNKERMMRVAEYSRDCLRALRSETGIQYEQRTGGTLQLFRTDKQLASAEMDIAVLKQCGVAYELLDRAGVCKAEPALACSQAHITGGLRLPGDETGDCQRFTSELATHAASLGVKFLFGRDVQALATVGSRVLGVSIGDALLRADRYVMAMGSYSRDLLQPLDLNIPVYPVKGYSLTVPLTNERLAPVSTVLDETYKIALTRFDDRIRVGGMAELNGFDLDLNPKRRATMEMVTRDLFPGGDLARAKFWTGLRPMTPDSTPIVGGTPYSNLFLNTGHGTLGWTMACGSAKLVSDIMIGRKPDISPAGLAMDRYQGLRGDAVPPRTVPA